MSDITYGFKVNPELKGKVAKMIEVSGLTSKDWFEGLVSLYELQQTKENEGIKKYLSEINALEVHTSRINEIFSSLLKKVIDEQKAYLKNIDDLRNENAVEIEKQLAHNRELEIDINRLSEQLKSANNEINTYVKQAQQLDELNTTQKMVIDDQQKENQRLNNQIQEFGSENSAQLKEELLILKNEFDMLKLQHANELLQLKSNHQQELIDNFSKKDRGTKDVSLDNTIAKKRGRPPKSETLKNESDLETIDSSISEEEVPLDELIVGDVNEND